MGGTRYDTPDGTQIAVESVATAALTPAPGFVERDMEEMWRDNCAVIRSVLEKSGVRAEEIAGVGLCGHGKGLYLWGKDGKPARRGILSADNRAWRYPVEWRENGTEVTNRRRWKTYAGCLSARTMCASA